MDVSASMGGEKLRTATNLLCKIFNDTMQSTDQYACITFSDTVRKLHKSMPKSRIKLDVDLKHITQNQGARTALWDGIKSAIGNAIAGSRFKGHKDDVIEVVIFTDGMDNISKATPGEIAALVKNPGAANFNITIIGIGNVDTKHLRDICKPPYAHFVHSYDTEGLKKAIQELSEQIRIRLTVKNSGLELTATYQGDRSDLGTRSNYE